MLREIDICFDKKQSLDATISDVVDILHKCFKKKFDFSYSPNYTKDEYDSMENFEQLLPVVFIKGYKKFGKDFFKIFSSDGVGGIGKLHSSDKNVLIFSVNSLLEQIMGLLA
jgi:hypothetical protein